MRDILHVSVPPIQGRIEDWFANTANTRMLFSLNLLEGLQHFPMELVDLRDVVEHILNKCWEAFRRDDGRCRGAEGVDEQLGSWEVRGRMR